MSREPDDRAVSDLVGYVLTVSILLLGVGVVSTVGVDQIERAQERQNVQNTERAMEVLEANFDEIQESRAAVRTTELSLGAGELGVATSSSPSRVTVEVLGSGNPPTTYEMRAIEYRLDDSVLAYEGGGVFFAPERGNAIPRGEPTFSCTTDRAVVSFVTLQGEAIERGYAGGTASVIARENASHVRYPINRSGDDSVEESTGVVVTIDSRYEGAWEGHMLDADQEWEQIGPSQYRCRDSPGSQMPVYVRQTVLNVSVRR